MSNISPESLLYETGHTAELLGLDEQALMAYIHQLSLTPRVDEKTGRLMLSQRDLEVLKRSVRIPETDGPSPEALERMDRTFKRFGSTPATPPTPREAVVPREALRPREQQREQAIPTRPQATTQPPRPPQQQVKVQPAQPSIYQENRPQQQAPAPVAKTPVPGTTPGTSLDKKDNLAVIVEAVSHAKEGILKDLSRLLDDKLAGLDEVVVELIRCKSENDTLKDKLKAALDEKESLRYELSKFKPVQFGFYRKSN